MTDSEPSSASPTLAAALERYELEPPARLDDIDRYCRLLWEWNEKLNLTRHTDYDKFVARDLFDAVQLAALLEPGEEVLDIGSGGGVPGVLLALLRDDIEVSLCESVGKKAKVLNTIARELQLTSPVYAARAENLLVELRFTTATARAVGPLAKLMQWLSPCWQSLGRLLAVKGPRWDEERAEARHRGLMHNVALSKAAEYTTPGSDIQNVILEIAPKGRARRPRA